MERTLQMRAQTLFHPVQNRDDNNVADASYIAKCFVFFFFVSFQQTS